MDVLHASVGGKTKGVELLRDRFIHPLATQQNVPDNEPALTQIRQLAPPECGSDFPVRHTSTAFTGRLSESGSSSLVGERNQGSDCTMTTRIEHFSKAS